MSHKCVHQVFIMNSLVLWWPWKRWCVRAQYATPKTLSLSMHSLQKTFIRFRLAWKLKNRYCKISKYIKIANMQNKKGLCTLICVWKMSSTRYYQTHVWSGTSMCVSYQNNEKTSFLRSWFTNAPFGICNFFVYKKEVNDYLIWMIYLIQDKP